jgi:hypothetical protein
MFIHYVLHCKNCVMPLLLPRDTIEQPFADQDYRPNDSLCVGVACPHCKSVETYFLHKKHPQHNPRDQAWLLENRVEVTAHVSTLECEEQACKARLPLFAQWRQTTTEQERVADIATWLWEHLQCPDGHSIVKPKGWPSKTEPFPH